MVKKKKEFLGDLEELILLAIVGLGGESYGVPIYEKVQEATERFTSLGAIYAALDRLEQKGFVSSRMGEATVERGGRAKKYFKFEGEGMRALEEAERVRQRMREVKVGLQPLAGQA